MSTLSLRVRLFVFSLLLAGGGFACGSAPPAPSHPAASVPLAIDPKPKDEPLDTSPVPEPAGLVVLARVSNPDSVASAIGSWTHLPAPSGRELAEVIARDSLPNVVGLA